MKIYNTLKKQKEEFQPLVPGEVSMYTCGVTVYDDCHIGHARSMYVFEVMRNYFQYRGYRVRFVRNITDIDDKILNKALALSQKEKIDITEAWDRVVSVNIDNYRKDAASLGLREPEHEPKASDYVDKIIIFINRIIDNGYAYESDGSVYFRTRKYADNTGAYGILSGRKIDELYSNVRKGEDSAKEEAADFVLWKAEKANEIAWPSPWGPGRPGWHIECSVMSTDILGETFDIHGGGLDLVFPHHENEISQSRAATGKEYARYWLHHGLLSVEKQKMSKSLGNFVTIQKILEDYSSDILKLFFLQAAYGSTIDYSISRMDEAGRAYLKILDLKQRIDRLTPGKGSDNTFRTAFESAMDDDFNMPKALAVLFNMASSADIKGTKELFYRICAVFGFDFVLRKRRLLISEDDILLKLNARKEAKANRDYAAADRIRDELTGLGVVIKDCPGGLTEWEYA